MKGYTAMIGSPRITTLCYLENNGKYLMLHRVSKKDDVNKGKWIGVGGKFEAGEAPEECISREVREETGFILKSCRYRGVLTFIYDDKAPEYIFTYTSDDFDGDDTIIPECDEGIFDWVKKSELSELELWEGDRYMLDYLLSDRPEPFSLKLVYDADDTLTEAWELSGIPKRLK